MGKTVVYYNRKYVVLLMLITATMASYVNETNAGPTHKDALLGQEFKILISNSIRSVAADPDNVWVATDRGISRFSRAHGCWMSYTKEDGLVSDNVYVVASDGEEVWFGTDNGLSRYKLAENKWITYREKDGLVSNKINCITQDENYIWIGTDKGLARFDRNIDSWSARTQKDGLTTDIVTSIAVEKDSVWVGTKAIRSQHSDDWRWREEKRRSGLNRYDKNTDSWNTYTPEEGLMSGQVSTIATDEDTVWIGTSDGGISCYSKKDQAFVKSYSKSEILDTNNIKFIFVDSIYTWIGTANGGVYRYIKTTDTWMRYTVMGKIPHTPGIRRDGLASNHITSIAVSGDEVWFGTHENGLSKYNKLTQKWTTYVKASYPADNDVRWISVNGDEVWAATTRGLSRYDTEKGQWTTYGVKDGLTSEYITQVELHAMGKIPHTPEDNDVFISMEDGLGRLDRETGEWEFYTDFADSSGLVTALEVVKGIGIPDPSPALLLIGTAGAGVFKLPLQDGGSPERFLTTDQLPDPNVTYIESDGAKVWIGTQGGLFQFDVESQSGRIVTQEDGLISNHVNVILQDNDNLWIGTTGGLSKLVLQRSEGYDRANRSWQTFTSQNGLPSDNVRALAITRGSEKGVASSDGKLWVGTPKGLVLLAGNAVTRNASPVTDFEIRTALFSESQDAFYNNIRSIGIRSVASDQSQVTRGTSEDSTLATGDWRLETESTLWLATAAGVLEFNPSTDEWREHRAEPKRTPFIESGVTDIELDGAEVWLSNWTSSPLGCIARFDRISKSWLRYTTRDILNVKPDMKTTTITNVRKIIPEKKGQGDKGTGGFAASLLRVVRHRLGHTEI